MSHQWSTDPQASQYGVPTIIHSKTYEGVAALATELYYHDLIRGNNLKGFLPIVGHESVDPSTN